MNLNIHDLAAIINSLNLAKETYGENCGTYLSVDAKQVDELIARLKAEMEKIKLAG